MNRIEAIYKYIDLDDKVVDVGCDQAKLSIMLAGRNQKSIACDISEKVINKAKENIKSNLIDLRVSNGLDEIKEGEADTLVLSGMGTHTIIDILSKTKLRFGLFDGSSHTLEEVGKQFKVTRERIRQIEAKALRKLRHPSRAKKLRDFLIE